MVPNQKTSEKKIGHRAYTIMVINQKIPARKHRSESIHSYGSKPENTRKKKLVTEHTQHYNGSKPENT